MRWGNAWLLSLFLVAGCSLNPNEDGVRLTVQVAGKSPLQIVDGWVESLFGEELWMSVADPTSVSQMECFALNVTGPEIEPIDNESDLEGADEHCTYIGEVSSVVENTGGPMTLELEVTPGPSRRIQLVGMTTGEGCDYTIADIANETADDVVDFAGEVGTTTVDVFQSREVTIANTFSTDKSFDNCGEPDRVEIPFIAGFEGTTGNANFGETIDLTGTAPWTDTTGSIAGAFGSPGVTYGLQNSINNNYAGFYLVYDASFIPDLNLFSKIEIEAEIAGGFQTGCTTPSTGSGVHVSILEGSLGAAATFSGEITASVGATDLTSPGLSFSTSFFSVSHYGGALTGNWGAAMGLSQQILVSVRSQDPADGTNCSAVEMDEVRVYLVP